MAAIVCNVNSFGFNAPRTRLVFSASKTAKGRSQHLLPAYDTSILGDVENDTCPLQSSNLVISKNPNAVNRALDNVLRPSNFNE